MKKRNSPTTNTTILAATEPSEGSRYIFEFETPTLYERLQLRMYEQAVAHLKQLEVGNVYQAVDNEGEDLMNEINFHLLQLQG